MPSILDYLDNPQFLSSVIGGGTSDSFGPQQPPQPPPPPPPNIMAQAPAQFGPGAAVDGGTGPADSFSARFSPGPEPISMPEPTKPKYEGGIFGGLGFKPLGWDDQPSAPGPQQSPGRPDQPGSALAFAGAPQTRNGYTYEDPPGLNLRNGPMAATSDPEGFARSKHAQAFPPEQPAIKPVNEISVNRTPRNGMSLDDAQLDRPTPVGNPMDIRSPAQSGQPAPRIDRARAFGNFMASLGKGLTAVGNQKPGTTGAAAFAGGAGGALEGYSEAERHNLDRDERGLDRAERGRERNQTFDYQNRTLAANTKYHDDLVEQHKLDRTDRTEQHVADREERAGRENWKLVGTTAEDQPVYHNQKTNERVIGDEKLRQRVGAGNQGGATEHLANIIREERGKDPNGKYKITMEEAVRLAQSHPTDAADTLRRERLADERLKVQEQTARRGDTRKTREDFRRELGLPPTPPMPPLPGALPPGTRSGVDPDRYRLPAGTPRNNKVEAATLPPPALAGTPGTPGTAGPTPGTPPGTPSRPPLPGPTPTPAPPFNPGPLPPSPTVGAGAPAGHAPAMKIGPTPPPPPNVPPHSKYSPSRNVWRAPDGTIIPGQPPQ